MTKEKIFPAGPPHGERKMVFIAAVVQALVCLPLAQPWGCSPKTLSLSSRLSIVFRQSLG
jgi:hypothetical protein